MVGLSAEGNLGGDLLALCMTFCMAGMMVISRHYQGIAVMPAACLASLLSGLIALPFAQHLAASGTDLFYLALFGLVNSAIGTVLFALGARLLPAIETGLIGALDAPLAPIWVWLAFGELPSRGDDRRRVGRLCRRLRPYPGERPAPGSEVPSQSPRKSRSSV